MSLLRDIQTDAVDSETDIGALLRKCKVLSVRLGNNEFKSWVDNELLGYKSKDDLPEYRILRTQSHGHFSGMFGSQLKNAPIPPSTLPSEFRDRITMSYLMGPISSYAALIDKDERSNLMEQWPADMVAYFSQKIYENMNCLSAWKTIPYNSIVALVDTIKVRVLNFALEIENEAPSAGEAPPNAPPLPQDRVSQVFNTYITGNVQNVAAGNDRIYQNVENIVLAGDFESLRKYLASLGIEAPDIEDLEKSIQEDANVEGKAVFGESVQAWIGKMVGKAASDTWKVSTSVAGAVLGKALLKYFDLE